MKTMFKISALAALMAGAAVLTTVPASAASGGWAARAEGKTGTYDNFNYGYGYRGWNNNAWRNGYYNSQPAYGYGYTPYGGDVYDDSY